MMCPICYTDKYHKMDCQNAGYVSRKDKRIAELESAIADFINVWEDDEMPNEEWDTKLESTRNRLKELKGDG